MCSFCPEKCGLIKNIQCMWISKGVQGQRVTPPPGHLHPKNSYDYIYDKCVCIYIYMHIAFYICVHSYSTCGSEIYLLYQQFYIRRFETLRLRNLQYVMKRFWVVTTSWTVHCLVVCSVCFARVSKLQNAVGHNYRSQETWSGHVKASWPWVPSQSILLWPFYGEYSLLFLFEMRAPSNH